MHTIAWGDHETGASNLLFCQPKTTRNSQECSHWDMRLGWSMSAVCDESHQSMPLQPLELHCCKSQLSLLPSLQHVNGSAGRTIQSCRELDLSQLCS